MCTLCVCVHAFTCDYLKLKMGGKKTLVYDLNASTEITKAKKSLELIPSHPFEKDI